MRQTITDQRGFSLVELSIVLLVLGLILTSTITGLSDLVWRARYAQAKKDLALAQEALIGYVISNGGLPCPDTDGYQGNPGTSDGAADSNGAGGCDDENGYLPWSDLGLKARDPWGSLYLYRVDTDYAKPPPISDQLVTFELTETDGNIEIRDGSGGAIIASNIVAVFFSVGPNGYILPAASSSADENENLDNNVTFVDKAYVAAGAGAPEFDDIMQWMSGFILKSKMLEAGRLPE